MICVLDFVCWHCGRAVGQQPLSPHFLSLGFGCQAGMWVAARVQDNASRDAYAPARLIEVVVDLSASDWPLMGWKPMAAAAIERRRTVRVAIFISGLQRRFFFLRAKHSRVCQVQVFHRSEVFRSGSLADLCLGQ